PMNDLVGERVLEKLADYLKRPFLANQIPGFLMDTTIEKLKVLPSGSTPYSLLEEQFAQPFSRLIERLSRMFDVVLLDSPPVALASPAEMLAGLADGVILVVKADGYDVDIVEQAKTQLEGAKHALAVNSCTAALHLALEAVGVGPADEVITTPMTFTATAAVIEHLGARPVFADCDAATLNIDPAAIERRITPRTKAILPVH